jgi:hypothetical protein
MLDLATLVAMAGSALIAGAFFAFSTFVMKALAALPAPQGIAAMQSINVVVINPLFLIPFAGTAVLSAGLAAAAVLRWQEPGVGYLLAGGCRRAPKAPACGPTTFAPGRPGTTSARSPPSPPRSRSRSRSAREPSAVPCAWVPGCQGARCRCLVRVPECARPSADARVRVPGMRAPECERPKMRAPECECPSVTAECECPSVST